MLHLITCDMKRGIKGRVDFMKNLIPLTQEDLPLQNKQHNEHSLQQNCSQEDEEG